MLENSMGRGRAKVDEPMLGMRSAMGTLSNPSPQSDSHSSLSSLLGSLL